MLFTKEAIKKINTVGSLKPSSKYLIRKCLKDLDFTKNQIIVEFGAGSGNFTEEILQRITTDSKLIVYETNQNFYEHCLKKFKNYKNFEIHHLSALEFDKTQSLQNKKVDHIISSLPLSLLNKELIDAIMQKVVLHLKSDGYFVQYQYSFEKYTYLKEKFKHVKLDFVLRNIPPSFIYKCSMNSNLK